MPIPLKCSLTESGHPRQRIGSLRNALVKSACSRIQTLRPAFASQVDALGVGAIESSALKPWLSRPVAILCRRDEGPPNNRRLPAISRSNTLGVSMQTKEVNCSAQAARASKACRSCCRLRSLRQSAGRSANAAFTASPGLMPAALAFLSASNIRCMPSRPSNTAIASRTFISSKACNGRAGR